MAGQVGLIFSGVLNFKKLYKLRNVVGWVFCRNFFFLSMWRMDLLDKRGVFSQRLQPSILVFIVFTENYLTSGNLEKSIETFPY